VNDAPHNSIRRYHSGIGLHTMRESLVDRDCLVRTRRIAADDSRNDSLSDSGILYGKKRPQTLDFNYILTPLFELHLEFIDLMLQLLIFLVNADQGEVGIPDVNDPIQRPIDQLFQGSQRVEQPLPHEARIKSVACLN
jgi:hypothetical protein